MSQVNFNFFFISSLVSGGGGEDYVAHLRFAPSFCGSKESGSQQSGKNCHVPLSLLDQHLAHSFTDEDAMMNEHFNDNRTGACR